MSNGILASESAVFGLLSGNRGASFHAEVVNPIGMSLKAWADAFVYVMASNIALPILMQESQFPSWAAAVSQEPQLVPFNLPDPMGKTWQEWAIGVNNALSTSASS